MFAILFFSWLEKMFLKQTKKIQVFKLVEYKKGNLFYSFLCSTVIYILFSGSKKVAREKRSPGGCRSTSEKTQTGSRRLCRFSQSLKEGNGRSFSTGILTNRPLKFSISNSVRFCFVLYFKSQNYCHLRSISNNISVRDFYIYFQEF